MKIISLKDFSRGLNTFFSPRDIKGFQKFADISNEKLGRLEKPYGQSARSASNAIEFSTLVPQGAGFFAYRTQYDSSSQNPTLWWLQYAPYATDSTADLDTGGGQLNDTDTSVPVSDIGVFTAPMYIKVDNEIMYVSAVNANLTVTRGAAGTTAASHGDSSSVWIIYWSIKRQDEADGTGGSWSEILSHKQSGDWTALEAAEPDFYSVYENLRISDGVLSQNNASKWYGHIKRDIFGQGITYNNDNIPDQPSQAEAVSEWNIQNQELLAPVMVEMQYPYDYIDGSTEAVDGANKVGLCIHYPDTGEQALIQTALGDLDTETFKAGDRYSITYEYDYTQESALGRQSDDILGVKSANTPTHSGKTIPGINIVLNTTSFNDRITGINIYWNPEDDIEWYLLGRLDTNKGWSEHPNAMKASHWLPGLTSDPINMGYWQNCPDMTNIKYGDTIITLNNTGGTTTTKSYNASGANWTSFGDPYAIDDIVFLGDSSLSAIEDIFTRTDTKVGVVTGFSSGNIQMDFTYRPIDHGSFYDSNPVGNGYTKCIGASQAANKITCWYIPNSGGRYSTYQSRTAREDDEKLPAVRWKTSCVSENGIVFIGNIDTEDENEQTIREESRVMYSLPGEPDNFNIIRSRDFGKSDGDTIIALVYWNGRVFVFKDRNTYIYNVSSQNYYLEEHYAGRGITHRYAYAITPYGIVVADKAGVFMYTGAEPVEISYNWRKSSVSGNDAYQSLTLSNSVLGYSPQQNALLMIPDTSEDNLTLFKYDFDTKHWAKETLADNIVYSNLLINGNLQCEGLQLASNATVYEFDTGSQSTQTATIKSKMLDGGNPYQEKKLKRLYATYKTGTMTTLSAETTEALDDSETGVDCDDVTVFSEGDIVKIENEVMYVTGTTVDIAPAGTLNVIRGFAGSTATTHTTAQTIYEGDNDLTIKVYFDGHTSADETLTFKGVNGIVTLGQDADNFSTQGGFKTIEVQIECADSGFVLEDLNIHYQDKGVKT